MARNRLLGNIVANVMGREVYRALPPQASPRGACLAAAVMMGYFSSLEEASGSVRGTQEVISPNPSTSAEYQEHYQRWLKLYHSLEMQ